MLSGERTGNLAFRASSIKQAEQVDPEAQYNHPKPAPSRWSVSRSGSVWTTALLAFICLLLLYIANGRQEADPLGRSPSATTSKASAVGPVLVSYSYYEKDAVQLANAEFFWKVGIGLHSSYAAPKETDFVVVVSGEACSPCGKLRPLLEADALVQRFSTLREAHSTKGLTLLYRNENEGMDFAAHNVTLEWVKKKGQYKRYRYFIFLNSSVRGPFFASYMPQGWQWTRAYTDRLSDDVAAVSSSIVCLPEVDAGGYGPKIESWAFALTPKGLELTTAAGVFYMRKCKLCEDDKGIVVKGEYGISNVLLGAGYNIATLMSRYGSSVDWRDTRHWHCNDNVHPSRHGTYHDISMHPFETVFLKASWHVGEPHLTRYTQWFNAHAMGNPGTGGVFDEGMYRYAISEEAQNPPDVLKCFKVDQSDA